ncbi:MAG: exo-alpha-sialidase [Williamsia sp.]|nr:exo-alpha-sialidase [Williamsia sp.]
MRTLISLILGTCLLLSYSVKRTAARTDLIIANGQMPGMAKDKDGHLHLVYGTGDSIMYALSSDLGRTFSHPSLIAVVPKLYAFANRGPQVAVVSTGMLVTATTSLGNIYAFRKVTGGKWMSVGKVNDREATAKEGLMALSADGNQAFAVWLDLRDNERNKIYGSRSDDGGRTWSKNRLVYTSPDTTVCECCKPSAVVKGKRVYVMFRNWLHGNRDLYLIQSYDGGNTFGPAQKLGRGSWKLNGCPMDGGGLAVNENGAVYTVWKRERNIYAAMPGMAESLLGQGSGCTVEAMNGKNVYAWVENGEVVYVNLQGEKKILGPGKQPVLKALDNGQAVCAWENRKQIHASVIE